VTRVGITRTAAFVIALIAIPLRALGDPRPPVPIALVDAPPAFDDARFVTAVETYVVDAHLAVVHLTAMTDDAVCAAILDGTPSPVVLWARWTDGTLSLSMVTVDQGCGAATVSTVDVPPDQPTFVYRVAALKIASLLRALPAQVPVPEPVVPIEVKPPAEPVQRSAPEHAVELGATGVASGEPAARTYALVASGWLGTRSSLGATVLASAAHEATAAGGSGRARVFGLLAGARRSFAHGGRVTLVGELDLGVLSVWSSADRTTGAAAMSEHTATPVAALAPHLRIQVAGPLHVIAGPTLEIASRPILLTLGDTPLYHASFVRFRWDVRAQLWF